MALRIRTCVLPYPGDNKSLQGCQVLLHQACEGAVYSNCIVRNQSIMPRLIADSGCPFTPLDCSLRLLLNLRVIYITGALNLAKKAPALCLYDEIGVVVVFLGILNLQQVFRRLDPFDYVVIVFKYGGEPSLRIRIEFHGWIETLRETSEYEAPNVQLVLNRLPEAPGILSKFNFCATGIEPLESPCHCYLVFRGFLHVVLVHLKMNQTNQFALVVLQYVTDIVLGRKIGLKMTNKLPGQLVKQLRMVVVADVVQINQTTHNVILQARFLDNTIAAYDSEPLIVSQSLDQEILRNRRIMDVAAIEIEVLEPDRHLASRNNCNQGNV